MYVDLGGTLFWAICEDELYKASNMCSHFENCFNWACFTPVFSALSVSDPTMSFCKKDTHEARSLGPGLGLWRSGGVVVSWQWWWPPQPGPGLPPPAVHSTGLLTSSAYPPPPPPPTSGCLLSDSLCATLQMQQFPATTTDRVSTQASSFPSSVWSDP